MNTRNGPTAELAVRTAIATALDRARTNGGAVAPITGQAPPSLNSLVWPSSHPSNTDPFDIYTGDVPAAGAILQAAGWELRQVGDIEARFKDGEVLEIEMFYDHLNGVLGQAVAADLVVQLNEAGIRVVASVLDDDVAFERRLAGDYDLVVAVGVASPDPVAAGFRWSSEFCPVQFNSPGCESEFATNTTGISDPMLDEILAAASAEPDNATRLQLFSDADQRLAEMVPSLPLFELPAFVAYSDQLGGVSLDTHRGGPFQGMADWGYIEDSTE